MCIFIYYLVNEWPHLGSYMRIWLTVCSICIRVRVSFSLPVSYLGVLGEIFVLIATIIFTFSNHNLEKFTALSHVNVWISSQDGTFMAYL